MTTAEWVQAVKAEALAGLGRLSDCQQALDLARATAGKSHSGGWLRFDGSRIAEESGACYVELGRPEEAEAALQQAKAQPLSARRQAMVLIDLAMVGVLRKDRAQVTHYAAGALDIARQTGSGVITRKLNSLQAHILEAL